MSTERETKTLKTAGGHEVAYKSWISGGEFNALQAVWLSGAKITLDGDETKVEGFDGLIEQKSQQKLIEILVISVDGKSDNVLKAVEDLPVADYQEVVTTLQTISGSGKKK